MLLVIVLFLATWLIKIYEGASSSFKCFVPVLNTYCKL